MVEKEPELNRILHQPVRTRIVAYLAARGCVTFTDLKNALDITDGNLEAHLKKLLAENYVLVKKENEVGSRPQSLYYLSEIGLAAFKEYVHNLQAILNLKESSSHE